jgi:hypothetical protein
MSTPQGVTGGLMQSATADFVLKVVQTFRRTPRQQKWLNVVVLCNGQSYGEKRLTCMPDQRVQWLYPYDDPALFPIAAIRRQRKSVFCDPSRVWTLIPCGDAYGNPLTVHDLLPPPGSDAAPGSNPCRPPH